MLDEDESSFPQEAAAAIIKEVCPHPHTLSLGTGYTYMAMIPQPRKQSATHPL